MKHLFSFAVLFLFALSSFSQCLMFQPTVPPGVPTPITGNYTLCPAYASSVLIIGNGTVTIPAGSTFSISYIELKGSTSNLIIEGDLYTGPIVTPTGSGNITIKSGANVFVVSGTPAALTCNIFKIENGFFSGAGDLNAKQLIIGLFSGAASSAIIDNRYTIKADKITSHNSAEVYCQDLIIGISGVNAGTVQQLSGKWEVLGNSSLYGTGNYTVNACIFKTDNILFESGATYNGLGYVQVNNNCSITSGSVVNFTSSAARIYVAGTSCGSYNFATVLLSPITPC